VADAAGSGAPWAGRRASGANARFASHTNRSVPAVRGCGETRRIVVPQWLIPSHRRGAEERSSSRNESEQTCGGGESTGCSGGRERLGRGRFVSLASGGCVVDALRACVWRSSWNFATRRGAAPWGGPARRYGDVLIDSGRGQCFRIPGWGATAPRRRSFTSRTEVARHEARTRPQSRPTSAPAVALRVRRLWSFARPRWRGEGAGPQPRSASMDVASATTTA